MTSIPGVAVASRARRPLVDRLPPDEQTPPGSSVLRRVTQATGLGLLVFLLIQCLLAVHNVQVIAEAFERGQLNSAPSAYGSLSLRLLTVFVGDGIVYLVVALAGVAIAHRGHRLLFILPAASYVLITVIGAGYAHEPRALGSQWHQPCWVDVCNPWFGHPWFGPLVDLALVLAPGSAVALRARARRWPGNVDVPGIAALLTTVGVVALAGWTITVIEAHLDVHQLLAVGALGLVLGIARPWWPWLQILFATCISGAVAWIIGTILWPDPSYTLLDVWPYILGRAWPMAAVALLASGWQPLAWTLRKMQDRPLRLVVAVNVLNVVDAVSTAAAVRSGGAVEANPVVRLGGLPAKVIFVGLLTWLLYRRQPKALVWPAAALLLVACYHVGGILVNP